jgi:ketosteroid isomerase-like protein
MSSTSSHRSLVKRLMDCWNSGQTEALDEIFAANFVRHGDHIDGRREIRGSAAYKGVINEFHKLLSDLHSEVRDSIEQGNKIAFRFHTTGIHNGKAIDFEGVNILRFDGDRIAEDWIFYDATGLAARLGHHRAAA